MANEFREITTTSWVKRIGSAFTGVILGIALFIGAFPVIFWNEGRSVERIRTLDEGRGLVHAISSDKVDPANEGRLVHFSGIATTRDILQDAIFGVQENALKLRRNVEMFQWEEKKSSRSSTNLGGSETRETTYTYEKIWSDKLINSSSFKQRDTHKNPASMPYRTETYTASTITLGGFTLSAPYIGQIEHYESYALSQRNHDAMENRFKKSFTLNGNEYFYGDPENPAIGALRITYDIISPTTVSVVGKQTGSAIQPYYTKNGAIQLLAMGMVGAETMFASAENENTLITWLVRAGACFMIWLGLIMVLRPIAVLGDVVPFIGSLLGVGVGLIATLSSLVLGFCAIAIAWIVYRPLIGGLLLVVAAVVFLGGVKMIRQRLQRV
ncbi:MAG: TMEM43 family protein [Alphaproteobacteria bacterium]|nr:TMEM43 family protein [Alphaproteobacteria bacterium]